MTWSILCLEKVKLSKDTAVFRGVFDDYELEFLTDNSVRITDNIDNRDGLDTLVNMEFAQFSDQTVDLLSFEPTTKALTLDYADDVLGTSTITARAIDSENESLNGDNGNDRLTGSNGAERLFGGANNDTLKDGSGKDRLTGEDDLDILFGNGGAERFLISNETTSANRDIIKDYQDGIDKFDLTGGLIFGSLNIVDNDAGTAALLPNNDQTLAVVENVFASELDSSDFV